MEMTFKVNKESILKEYLKECGVSRTMGRKIKLYGKFYVNGTEVENHFLVHVGDVIKIVLPTYVNETIKKIAKPIEILYEDEWILIVNKEHDLAIQPSNKHQDDNLVGRILHYFSKENSKAGCHILTRLDLATSGIVIIAKSAYVHNLLTKIEVGKFYLAKTSVKLAEDIGSIHLPIARDITSNIKRTVDVNGKSSDTVYKLIKDEGSQFTYSVQILTGRTHQIRVHFSHIGSPIIGDILYEGKSANRLYLHCYMVEFIHPINNKKTHIINYPKDIGF